MKNWNHCLFGLCVLFATAPRAAAAGKDSPPSPSTNPAPATLEALVGDVVEHNPELFNVSLARKERYPAFTAGPFFSQERAGDREQQAGIGVSLPLPLWNKNKGNIETAAARQKQAETSLYVTQRDIERRVVEQALTYQTKLGEMAQWRPDSVEEFRKAADLADRHYRLGTYVEMQKQYLEAVAGLHDMKKEALEAAAHIELLTGLTSPLACTTPKDTKP